MTENIIVKDRELTEQKILDAVGKIIAEEGFEKAGVNAIAQKAGVSKILIYRYFGSIEELLAKYILQKDYWINIKIDESKIKDAGNFIKNMFRKQAMQLRDDITLKRLYRWELSTNSPIIKQLQQKRETNGCQLIKLFSHLTQSPETEIAALASILSASISYLALLEESCPIYNGINLQSNNGWEQVINGIDLLIDLWLKNKQQ